MLVKNLRRVAVYFSFACFIAIGCTRHPQVIYFHALDAEVTEKDLTKICTNTFIVPVARQTFEMGSDTVAVIVVDIVKSGKYSDYHIFKVIELIRNQTGRQLPVGAQIQLEFSAPLPSDARRLVIIVIFKNECWRLADRRYPAWMRFDGSYCFLTKWAGEKTLVPYIPGLSLKQIREITVSQPRID